jgi:hypothetical protein
VIEGESGGEIEHEIYEDEHCANVDIGGDDFNPSANVNNDSNGSNYHELMNNSNDVSGYGADDDELNFDSALRDGSQEEHVSPEISDCTARASAHRNAILERTLPAYPK